MGGAVGGRAVAEEPDAAQHRRAPLHRLRARGRVEAVEGLEQRRRLGQLVRTQRARPRSHLRRRRGEEQPRRRRPRQVGGRLVGWVTFDEVWDRRESTKFGLLRKMSDYGIEMLSFLE